MNQNPWSRLPSRPPYVLPGDAEVVREINSTVKKNHKIKLDILPEPFVGAPNAPVVLLSNNPGFGNASKLKRDPQFTRRMRQNLRHEDSPYPFLYLDPKIGEVGGWWVRKLKRLIEHFDREVVARSILNVVYSPYPSVWFRKGGRLLESQQYGFHLVRRAISRNAVIVFMRKGDGWCTQVPELCRYDRRYRVRNWQNPVISENNCDGFELIVRAIKDAEAKKR